MYAGVSSNVNTVSNVAVLDNDNLDIPEWKKMLIMKKRTSNVCNDDQTLRNSDSLLGNVNITRNIDSSTCDNCATGCSKFGRSVKVAEQDFREISPPKTVTIGNINVELRSVKSSVDNHDVSGDTSKLVRISNSECNGVIESEDDACEDLQYGPGIVDRLRAKFLNMGAKKQRKPVVRRFSSLENLPGSNTGPYRVNARGIRQNGFKVGSGNYYGSGNVKKAQSMETLISCTSEQHIFNASRRPNARYVGGVKARILAKNISPITMFTDENDEPNEKSLSPSSSPRLFTKFVRRWDYNRSTSAPNINEDELPKPDTVKHVKKMFESPPLNANNNSSEKTSNPAVCSRFRKIPGTTTSTTTTTTPPANITTPTSVCNNSAISGSVLYVVKKLEVVKDSSPEDAKQSAKEFHDDLDVNTIPETEELPPLSPEVCDEYKINKGGYSPVLEEELSAIGSCDTPISQKEKTAFLVDSPDGVVQHNLLIPSPETTEEREDDSEEEESSVKVTPEQLPLEGYKHSTEVLSQGGEVIQSNGVELTEDEDLSLPHPGVAVSPDDGMVVAAAASSDTFSAPSKKGATWQKAPPTTTSIVFDFRGKDVKPNISLQPTPFGCRPAKVSRSNTNSKNKRSSSPMRTGVNGMGLPPKDYDVDDEHSNGVENVDDEEDWDEMDIGADLPAISGIVFRGENVKIGRGAFLETRNKKLTIQFDDHATSTFEYPSENTNSMEENGDLEDSSFDPSAAIGSEANSRIGLSNYTPQVLSSSNDFELGVSQPNHRPNSFPVPKSEIKDIPTLDIVVPATADDAEGWSASGTSDILF